MNTGRSKVVLGRSFPTGVLTSTPDPPTGGGRPPQLMANLNVLIMAPLTSLSVALFRSTSRASKGAYAAFNASSAGVEGRCGEEGAEEQEIGG